MSCNPASPRSRYGLSPTELESHSPQMTLKLKPSLSSSPFSFENLPTTPPPISPSTSQSSLPSPPTSWLSAADMKVYGADPLRSVNEFGIVQCKECSKPILRSAIAEHVGESNAFFIIY